MTAYYLPCPECAGPIDDKTIYHEVEVIDPDISNQTMLAENANCPDCGDVFLRNASGDFR